MKLFDVRQKNGIGSRCIQRIPYKADSYLSLRWNPTGKKRWNNVASTSMQGDVALTFMRRCLNVMWPLESALGKVTL